MIQFHCIAFPTVRRVLKHWDNRFTAKTINSINSKKQLINPISHWKQRIANLKKTWVIDFFPALKFIVESREN